MVYSFPHVKTTQTTMVCMYQNYFCFYNLKERSQKLSKFPFSMASESVRKYFLSPTLISCTIWSNKVLSILVNLYSLYNGGKVDHPPLYIWIPNIITHLRNVEKTPIRSQLNNVLQPSEEIPLHLESEPRTQISNTNITLTLLYNTKFTLHFGTSSNENNIKEIKHNLAEKIFKRV